MRAVSFFFSPIHHFYFPPVLISFHCKNKQKRKGEKGTCLSQVFPLFPAHKANATGLFLDFTFFYKWYPSSKISTFHMKNVCDKSLAELQLGHSSWLSTGITSTQQPWVMCTEHDLPAEARALSWYAQKILAWISSPCTTVDMLWSYTNINSSGRKMAQKNRTQLFSMRKLKFTSPSQVTSAEVLVYCFKCLSLKGQACMYLISAVSAAASLELCIFSPAKQRWHPLYHLFPEVRWALSSKGEL